MSEGKYEKTCKNPDCKKTFHHDARNTRYCSPECAEVMQKKAAALGKRRRQYKKNAPMLRAQSMSRKQARYHALNNMVKTKCQICNEEFFLRDIEVAHLDQNCFNNAEDCSNFALLCQPCHTKLDCEFQKQRPKTSDNPGRPKEDANPEWVYLPPAEALALANKILAELALVRGSNAH